MKIYLADTSNGINYGDASLGAAMLNTRLKILLSYWYYKDTDLDELFSKYFTPPYPQVLADSGAFSAYTQGVTITVAEYAAWVNKFKHLFTNYLNLDVIGDDQATMRNQHKLESCGLTPLPVFHTGSEYKVLKELVANYSYIALGGLVPYLRFDKKVMPHLIKCFKIAEKKAVFHGLGVTNWTILKAFPWYSVDSSAWGQGFRYGTVPLFSMAKGRFTK